MNLGAALRPVMLSKKSPPEHEAPENMPASEVAGHYDVAAVRAALDRGLAVRPVGDQRRGSGDRRSIVVYALLRVSCFRNDRERYHEIVAGVGVLRLTKELGVRAFCAS